MKKCFKCNVFKNLDQFAKDKYSKDSRWHTCKECYRNRLINKKLLYIAQILKERVVCPICYDYLNLENINTHHLFGKDYIPNCKNCYKKQLQYNKKHATNKCFSKRRAAILLKYGNKCDLCQESLIEFLCIDHRLGNGTKHRKNLGGTSSLYTNLKKHYEPDKYRVLCQNCNQSISIMARRKKADENKDVKKYSDRKRNKYRELRKIVIDHYGHRCSCCGESDFFKLSIDHIDGGGKQHLKEIGGPNRLCEWIIKQNFPDNFRLLCHNCNFSLGQYGYCPHAK